MSKTQSESKMTVSGLATVAMSTLASRTVILLASPAQVVGGTLITERSLHQMTGVDAQDGPYLIGVASGALSATEIETYLENNGPSGPTHSGQTEISSRGRHIRILGLLTSRPESDTARYLAYFEKVVKLGWAEQDAGWNYWCYNAGPTLVAGSTWEINTVSFVVYDRD